MIKENQILKTEIYKYECDVVSTIANVQKL